MPEFKERRNYQRIQVTDATVAYRVHSYLDIFNRYSNKLPVKDIAKSGICFETKRAVNRGKIVDLKIVIPGQKKIQFKGNVVWSANIKINGSVFTGIQFLPFGKGLHRA